MTPTETAAILRQYNVWRRGNLEGQPQPDPREIGEAIDAAVEMIERMDGASREAALMAKLEAAEKERDELRTELKEVRHEVAMTHYTINTLQAKVDETEKQEPVAWCATDETETVVEALGMNKSRRFGTALYLAPGAQPAPSALAEAIIADMQAQHNSELITENDSGEALIRLDGAIAAVEDNFALAQPTPSIPEGWLRAIDEALVVAHVGVANKSDTYEQAKEKLNNLIGFHVDGATDPAVNGGYKLVSVRMRPKTKGAGE